MFLQGDLAKIVSASSNEDSSTNASGTVCAVTDASVVDGPATDASGTEGPAADGSIIACPATDISATAYLCDECFLNRCLWKKFKI